MGKVKLPTISGSLLPEPPLYRTIATPGGFAHHTHGHGCGGIEPATYQVRENLAYLYDNLAESCKLQGHYDKVVAYLEKAIQLRQSVE